MISTIPKNWSCPEADAPIAALFMNGTEDPVVPFNGGEIIGNRGEVKSTEAAVNYWKQRNDTDNEATEKELANTDTTDNSRVKKFSYRHGVENTEVVLYKIINGGHTCPSIDQQYSSAYLNLVGSQNHDIESAKKIWAFFANHTN